MIHKTGRDNLACEDLFLLRRRALLIIQLESQITSPRRSVHSVPSWDLIGSPRSNRVTSTRLEQVVFPRTTFHYHRCHCCEKVFTGYSSAEDDDNGSPSKYELRDKRISRWTNSLQAKNLHVSFSVVTEFVLGQTQSILIQFFLSDTFRLIKSTQSLVLRGFVMIYVIS